tara:strand:- start:748 stop:1074 length:327 start_codon:yes stop_codon:yes gene_type:complete
MAITITEFAEEKISEIMSRSDSQESYLRIGLRSGGCSGFSYDFDFASEPMEDDKIFSFDKLKICVERKSYLFLIGMEIDYEETIMRSGIVLNNPNAKRACGCGESISF